MVVDEVMQALEKRRSELVDLLENRSQGMELEKQHQIYGAINEIDLFMQTINYYEKNSSVSDIDQINLVKPVEQKKHIFARLFDGLKGKVFRNR